MTKVLIHLPENLKAKLDNKRRQGFTISGYVRTVLEKDLNQPAATRGRKER